MKSHVQPLLDGVALTHYSPGKFHTERLRSRSASHVPLFGAPVRLSHEVRQGCRNCIRANSASPVEFKMFLSAHLASLMRVLGKPQLFVAPLQVGFVLLSLCTPLVHHS